MVFTLESFIDFCVDERSEYIFENHNPAKVKKDHPIIAKAKVVIEAIKKFITETVPNFFRKLFDLPINRDSEFSDAVNDVKRSANELKSENSELASTVKSAENVMGKDANVADPAAAARQSTKFGDKIRGLMTSIGNNLKTCKDKMSKLSAMAKRKADQAKDFLTKPIEFKGKNIKKAPTATVATDNGGNASKGIPTPTPTTNGTGWQKTN